MGRRHRWSARLATFCVATFVAASSVAAESNPPAQAVDDPGGGRELRTMPAAPVDVLLTQPDGTTFMAQPWGVAGFNGYEVDGYTVETDDTDTWRYVAGIDPGGETVLSSARADRGRPPAGTGQGLRPVGSAKNKMAPAAPPPRTRAPHAPLRGNVPTLVILAQFTDMPSRGTTPASWADKYFGATNSVRDYYDDQSFGGLDVVPASETSGTSNDGIVGWVNVGMAHPNSGVDDSPTGWAGDHELIRRAIVGADPYVDFASYDTNGNGVLDRRELSINVIAAGYETAYSGPEAACGSSVWAHAWAIGGYGVSVPTVDGTQVGGEGYLLFGEQHCSTSDNPGHPATLGTIVHEMAHLFDLPDLYDIDQSSEGVGDWSLMASGSWNKLTGQHAGSLPAGLDAFSRTYQGWVTPTRVGGSGVNVPLDQSATNPHILQLRDNPGGVDWNFGVQSGAGEYFLVENRQKVGYDAALPGCGVLIWHIDETVTSGNDANADENRPLVGLAEADGQADLWWANNQGDDGDPYPGGSGNTLFANTTNPDSKLYSGASSGVSVGVANQACAPTMNLTVTAPGSSDPGRLRVATSPSVPSQIRLDGHIADSWGLNWLKVAPGQHEVCFRDVPGHTTPGCQTVAVTPGRTTTVSGAFTPRGYLRVQTSPPLPSTITIDGNPANDWGVWSDVPAGSHQVCFGAVPGHAPPPCQTVMVTAGVTTTVTGSFTGDVSANGEAGKGMLRVQTSPAVPSRIRIDGHDADTWGLDWVKLTPGAHQVCFGAVPGYTTPPCKSVTVTAGQTTTAVGSFDRRGMLKVETTPPVPGTITIDGNPANDWGVFTDLPVGSHTVCFGPVPGRTTPACRAVTLTAGATRTTTGAYT